MERLTMTDLYRLSKATGVSISLLAEGALCCIGDGGHADPDRGA